MAGILAGWLVLFYRVWHGRFHISGAGRLLRGAARLISPLQNYTVEVPGIGNIPLDFRGMDAYAWINFLLGEAYDEEGLVTALSSHFTDKTVFWDIGANIGLVSGNLIRRFPSATFCLFEPNPDLIKRLRPLFREKPNVVITETALSDRNACARFHIVPGDSLSSRLLPKDRPAGGGIEVELQTGDHFLATHPGCIPTVIKIDVEGHELEVLAGCRDLIAAHRPVIVFEHLFLTDDALRSLTFPGYALFYLHDKTGALSPTLDRHISHNAILIPKT